MLSNLFQTHVFLVFVLGATPNHIPLKNIGVLIRKVAEKGLSTLSVPEEEEEEEAASMKDQVAKYIIYA